MLFHRRMFVVSLVGAVPGALISCVRAARGDAGESSEQEFEITRTDAEWRRLLAPEQFRVLREHDTEPPGSSPLNNEHRAGLYRCAGCGLPLFSSGAKFESGTGWPSFTEPLPGAVGTSVDRSFLMVRTEVHCRRCGGHLGHVFADGPRPTGLRYCINGAALTFAAREADR